MHGTNIKKNYMAEIFSMSQLPLVGQGFLSVEASRSHSPSVTHHTQ